MSRSSNAEFEYLVAAQAQKHLTVNDALCRLDSISQLSLHSLTSDLPATANDGDCFWVRTNDANFANNAGKIAIYDNGGFVFVTPKTGWRAFVIDTMTAVFFDGSAWVPQDSGMKILKFDQTLSGNSVNSTVLLPEKTSIVGVTARVVNEITGPSLTSWSLGVAGSLNRYGSGLWLGVNGWARGLTGAPMTYWSNEPLVITPDSGSFTAGTIRIYIHYIELALPPEV